MNTCGSGSTSSVFSFTTEPIPPILLVDDDDNSPNVRATYTAALDALGLSYDIWDTANSDNEPNFGYLSAYQAIIWFTGDEFGGFAGPGGVAEANLGTWLDNGNCLFISSQDYLYDRGLTAFMSSYLGVGTFTSDNGTYTSVTGMGSVFGGLGPYSLSYPFTNFADTLSPGGSAELAFDGNNGIDAAINKDNGTYRTSFFGYPFEAISSAAGREEVMQTVVDWCGVGAPSGTLEGQVTDSTDNSPIAGATITADDGNEVETTTTDSNGNYDLSVPPGDYAVTASATNYFSQTVGSVSVLTDTVTVQDFSLDPAIGTLEVSENTIEDTVTMGDVVTHTLTVSNTGTVAFTFTANPGAAWADVSPSGGTLNPGESMVLSVVLDSNATASEGTYNTTLSFSGDYTNSPAPVDLILHVLADEYSTFLPVVVGSGGGAAAPTAAPIGAPLGALPWLFPLLGLTAVAGLGYRQRGWLSALHKGNDS
jgi:hypothetical protein